MSERLPSVRPRQVLAALERAGFYVHHTTGSHYGLRHSTRHELRVTIPMHNRDLYRATLRSILRQAGLTAEGFLKVL
jgi:predicted RNA binding protein YcfA (HicA-like mRNA interferase family)